MVDILLATYNGQKYLESLLDSLFGQSYLGFKIIIRDDGSCDDTLKIIDKYVQKFPDKIFIVKDSFEIKSANKSFFELLKHSTSEYIMFCDQDDVWHEDKIKITLDKMKALEETSLKETPILVFTDLLVTDENLNIIANSFIKMQKLDFKPSNLNRLLIQNNVTGCTVMINKSVKTFVQYPIGEPVIMHDWWLSIICSCFGKIGFVEKPTIMYRQHSKNTVGAKKNHLLSSVFKFKSEKDRVVKSIYRSFSQAEYFFLIYENKLSEDKKIVFKNFSKLKEAKGFKRVKMYFQNNFFKSGFVMKLVQIAFSYY